MNGHRDSTPFDVGGPLPTGVTVLEASAGTGKTTTIAALAARYVAEGTPLERLLLVTFTRMATSELRERVRERLVGVERGLGRALAGADAADARDEVVALLAGAAPAEVHLRRERLARALADFDAATIATTHGFCQEMLSSLGSAGDLDPDTTFVEDTRDLVSDVVDDLYVRRFHGGDAPPFGREEAGQIARLAIDNPAAPLVSAAGEVSQMRSRLAAAVRSEFDDRKRRMGLMDYDDLLTRLDGALSSDGGAAVATRLRERFAVVLVDEFQDTDPVQWRILQRAFGQGVALVLIGDPKQAIYAFRGADVYAYLAAARAADARATLEVNWRSDQGLIDAYDTMFGGAKLGDEGIVYRRVRAADANRAPRLSGAPRAAPLRLRVVHRDDPSVALTAKGFAQAAGAREHIAADVGADLVALLSSPAEIERRTQDGAAAGRERVRPGHVAVLVPTNRNAALIRQVLEDAGIPAVINGGGSVFATPTAREWLRLLEAIERPASPSRARSAALTCFLGWSTERLAAAGEDGAEAVHRRLHDWARVLRSEGIASLTETITLGERLPQRILATAGGERRLTDLRHIAQLLHAAAATEQRGTTALTAWLRRRIAEAQRDGGDEERSRRLESDAEAVQVLTIHRSKGLEFPIVYLPFLWEPGYIPDGAKPVFFHDPDTGERMIDVSLQGVDFRRHQARSLVEQRGEDLRLAYVALTRAKHQAVMWWAGSWDSRNSPLGRLLFARDAEGNVEPTGDSPPDDASVVARFQELAARAPGCITVERSSLGLPVTWSGPPAEPAELTASLFRRALDWHWRRTSYSDIAAGAYEPWVRSEPEEPVIDDEPPAAVQAAGVVDESLATPSLLAQMAVGVDVGTLVHRVLEAADFAAPDLDDELSMQIATAQAWRRVAIGDHATVVAGLGAAIRTPLGPLLGGLRLRDVRRADRLDELAFELPLAGGDDPTGRVALQAVADALREHLEPADPLAAYADRLADPALRQTVRGYLTGSLDAVLRVAGDRGVARFAVVDYKTNWLAAPGEPLTAFHHRPEALAAEMRRVHYALQALLYTVALHRYLRWRLPGYAPERNLAGVLYLFLRGMSGPDTPAVDGHPCGVFAWRPPAPLVAALSDVLDGGAP